MYTDEEDTLKIEDIFKSDGAYKPRKKFPIGKFAIGATIFLILFPPFILSGIQAEWADAYLYTSIGFSFIKAGIAAALIPTYDYLLNFYRCNEHAYAIVVRHVTISLTNPKTNYTTSRYKNTTAYMYVPIYEYTVNGVVYQETTGKTINPPPVDSTSVIYYNKKHPEFISAKIHKPGISRKGLIVTLICFAIGAALLYFNFGNTIFYDILIKFLNFMRGVLQ